MTDELKILGDHVRRSREQPLDQLADEASVRAVGEPLDDAAKARIAEKILAMRAARAPAGNVVPGPARWFRRFGPAAALAAAAAAAALFLLRPGPAPIPEYTVSASGVKDLRGDTAPTAALRVRPGSFIDVVVRPASSVSGPIAAHSYVVRDGAYSVFAGPTQIAPSGAIHITGPSAPLLGASELRVVVGRPDVLGLDPVDKARQKGAAERGWQTLSVPIESE